MQIYLLQHKIKLNIFLKICDIVKFLIVVLVKVGYITSKPLVLYTWHFKTLSPLLQLHFGAAKESVLKNKIRLFSLLIPMYRTVKTN